MSRLVLPSFLVVAVLLAGSAAGQTIAVVPPGGNNTYGLSTFPQPIIINSPAPAPMPAFGFGGFGGFGGLGGFGYGPVGNALQGFAAVTAATGQYHKDIQDARITRYAANNAAIDSAKKTIEAETWYEQRKQRLWKEEIESGKRTQLQRARTSAPDSEIWSGSSFNVLLTSILSSSSPLNGPGISVPPPIVSGLNFMERGSRGNVGMAKDEGKIAWTFGLGGHAFDTVRDRFGSTFAQASSSIRSGDAPNRDTIASLRADLKKLETTLEDQFDNMSPGDYTTSRRLLRQLRESVTGMADPRVVASHGGSRRSLRTVADIVGYLRDNGMQFGPATASGDQVAYSAFYYSLRDYERGLSSYAGR